MVPEVKIWKAVDPIVISNELRSSPEFSSCPLLARRKAQFGHPLSFLSYTNINSLGDFRDISVFISFTESNSSSPKIIFFDSTTFMQ